MATDTGPIADQEPVKMKPSIIEAVDQTANEIEPLLEPEAVTELVIESLTRLPRWGDGDLMSELLMC